MQEVLSWRNRRFHIRLESCCNKQALETRLEELCKNGWEPISVLQTEDGLTMVLKHYCTRPDKDCILCVTEK